MSFASATSPIGANRTVLVSQGEGKSPIWATSVFPATQGLRSGTTSVGVTVIDLGISATAYNLILEYVFISNEDGSPYSGTGVGYYTSFNASGDNWALYLSCATNKSYTISYLYYPAPV